MVNSDLKLVEAQKNSLNIYKETNIKIEIISGKKESEIVASNDISDHIGDSPNYCFIDVGGGSTEVIIYKNHKLYKKETKEP